MRKLVLLTLVFAATCLNLNVRSEAAAPLRDTPATTTILDIDPITGMVYRVGSDSLGTYQNGVDSVSSIVQGIGNWVLDTKLSPLRKARVDLGDPVPNSGANSPFQAATVPVRFISKCTTNITTLAVNQTIPCPLAISIVYNGVTYALRAAEPTAPGTDPVSWTCLARNTTKCISWSMTPSVVQANGQQKIKMTLLKVATKN
ncbi:MAG: hypothetical protein ABJB40_06220, partial [Acidobacteriota bacterium]